MKAKIPLQREENVMTNSMRRVASTSMSWRAATRHARNEEKESRLILSPSKDEGDGSEIWFGSESSLSWFATPIRERKRRAITRVQVS